jgi:hypothetical protein
MFLPHWFRMHFFFPWLLFGSYRLDSLACLFISYPSSFILIMLHTNMHVWLDRGWGVHSCWRLDFSFSQNLGMMMMFFFYPRDHVLALHSHTLDNIQFGTIVSQSTCMKHLCLFLWALRWGCGMQKVTGQHCISMSYSALDLPWHLVAATAHRCFKPCISSLASWVSLRHACLQIEMFAAVECCEMRNW